MYLGILIFDDVEVLDFTGPFEVFSMTNTISEGSFQVVTLAQKAMITARNGLKVVPDYIIGKDEIPQLKILILPGGQGILNEINNESLLNWIKSIEPSLQNILTVCTGVSLLGKCGLIDGLIVTTHRMRFEAVQLNCPKSKLCKCRRFTDNGKFLTSAGISAGIDLSFYFVKKTLGENVANEVANRMEYDWKNLNLAECTCNFK